jgi:hypothetical protein
MYENEKENRLVEEDPKSTDSDRGGGDHGPTPPIKKKKKIAVNFLFIPVPHLKKFCFGPL